MQNVAEAFSRRQVGDLLVFTGAFGSGKTEVVLNLGVLLAGDEPVTLVDLDVVTPYFRLRQMQDFLRSTGIQVVSPPLTADLADLPIVPQQLAAILGRRRGRVLIDVGGDEEGTRVLGSILAHLVDARTFMVINPWRPTTGTPEEIESRCRQLEQAARKPLDGLISNPNLADQTEVQHVEQGHRAVVAAGRRLDKPILCVGVPEGLAGRFDPVGLGAPVLPVRRHMLAPWE